MNDLVRQGLVSTRRVTRTIAIVGADVSMLAMQTAGSVFSGALAIGAGHLLWGTACRDLGDTCLEVENSPIGFSVPSSDHAA